MTGFTTLAALYMEQVQIVTLDPEIKTVGDLAGKTVSIGAVGSGVYFNAIDVLGAYDLTEDDISPVYQNFDDSVESLQDGRIDAAFIVAGAPTTSIVQLPPPRRSTSSASTRSTSTSSSRSAPTTAPTPSAPTSTAPLRTAPPSPSAPC